MAWWFSRQRSSADIDKLIARVDKANLPVHVAVIMDGNGRWAKQRGLPRVMGHRAGMEVIRKLVKLSSRLGIHILTLYAFSTENWKRPADEVNFLMNLLVEYLTNEVEELHRNNVRITAIGRLTELPEAGRKQLFSAMDYTAGNTGLILNLALNYGGRAEILDAINEMIDDVKNGSLGTAPIDDSILRRYLYTKDLPDPDLLIRTSGEQRISNFLLYQLAYAEFYFSKLYWPDFGEEAFLQAIIDYQHRHRRYGGI